MHRSTVFWLAAAALVLVPTGLAQGGVYASGAVAARATPLANGAVPETVDASLAPDGSIDASAGGTEIRVDPKEGLIPSVEGLPNVARALPGGIVPGVGAPDQAKAASAADGSGSSRSRPWVDTAVSVTATAGKTAFAVLLITALASGFESVRAVLFKPLVGFGRRWLAFPLVAPLFSRIQRDDVLDNPARARIHEIVMQEPGISLRDVRDRAGVAWGTAVHHLRRLESHGLIISVRQGPHRRFFDVKAHGSRGSKGVAALFQPTARRIAGLVAERPGINQSGLCQELGLRNPAASKHLGNFESLGLVLCTPAGRSRVYHATDALRSALRSMGPVVQLHPSASPVVHARSAATATATA